MHTVQIIRPPSPKQDAASEIINIHQQHMTPHKIYDVEAF